MNRAHLQAALAATTALALLPQAAAPVLAQAQEAQAPALEEIVVTARKRAESLQEIPVSVTAFTADQIERAGFVDLEDVAVQTPGFQFNNQLAGLRPGRLFSNMRFRGIEGSEFATLQTASLFVDGVFALQGAQSISLMDLERVEIIKGPQSAQFGRNSFAGAVNYITSDPSVDEFSGRVQIEGATRDSYELQARHEGPLVDGKLAYRLNARLYQKGAQWTATDGGALGEQTTRAVSGMLLGKPSDAFELKLRVFYQKDNDGPAPTAFLVGRLNDTCTGKTVTTKAGLTLRPVRFVCGDIPSPGAPNAPLVTSNTSLFPADRAFTGANANFLVTQLLNFNQVPGVPKLNGFGLEREIFRASLQGGYDFANGMSLDFTAAYNDNAANDLRDWDMTDNPTFNQWYVTNPQAGDDLSFDVRLQSSGEDRLRWMAGGNYYTQDFRTSGNGGVFVTACGNFAGLGTGETGFCSAPGLFPTGLDANDFIDVWGVYGTLSYDIVENLTLDLEARYMNDERGDGTGFTRDYKQFLPRVSLSYQATDEVNLYANWSRGKLPGVINSNVINCQTQTYTQPFIDPRTGRPSTSSECQQYTEALGDRAQPFTPQQTLEAWEVGIKTTLADGRATVNLAAYDYKWKNQPFNTFVTVVRDDNGDRIPNTNVNFFPVQTPGSSKSQGIELETAFAPAEGWNFQANLSYNKNKFIEFFTALDAQTLTLGGAPNTQINVKGNRASRFPKWQGNLAGTYTGAFTGDWDWFARGDLVYNGRHFTGLTNLATVKSWFNVALRAGVEQDGVRMEVFVKNLLDTERWAAGQEITDFTLRFPPFDFTKLGVILLPQDKRQFGIRTSLDF
ncbi:MAG: TonB-dependent receptor [Rhodospirillaceae bacterium]|nr:TonB-dependent receptor [Rhodospirillaceae bacterium]